MTVWSYWHRLCRQSARFALRKNRDITKSHVMQQYDSPMVLTDMGISVWRTSLFQKIQIQLHSKSGRCSDQQAIPQLSIHHHKIDPTVINHSCYEVVNEITSFCFRSEQICSHFNLTVSITRFHHISKNSVFSYFTFWSMKIHLNNMSKSSPYLTPNVPNLRNTKKIVIIMKVTGVGWPRGFQEVKVPRFHDNGTGWW